MTKPCVNIDQASLCNIALYSLIVVVNRLLSDIKKILLSNQYYLINNYNKTTKY